MASAQRPSQPISLIRTSRIERSRKRKKRELPATSLPRRLWRIAAGTTTKATKRYATTYRDRFAALTKENADQRWLVDNEAQITLGHMGAAIVGAWPAGEKAKS